MTDEDVLPVSSITSSLNTTAPQIGVQADETVLQVEVCKPNGGDPYVPALLLVLRLPGAVNLTVHFPRAWIWHADKSTPLKLARHVHPTTLHMVNKLM